MRYLCSDATPSANAMFDTVRDAYTNTHACQGYPMPFIELR
jgi:hypothetical protein